MLDLMVADIVPLPDLEAIAGDVGAAVVVIVDRRRRRARTGR